MSETPPQLRSQLEFLRTGPRAFLLHDPVTGQVFELGEHEHFLARGLDGTQTSHELQRGFELRFGESISELWIDEFIASLRLAGLLTDSDVARAEDVRPTAGDPATIKPLSLAAPQGGLNLVFDLLVAALGWMIHPLSLLGLALLLLAAGNVLARHHQTCTDELVSLTQDVGTWKRIPLFLVLMVGAVSLPRAVATGIACRQLGGRLHGFRLAVERRLLPYVECDVGDSLQDMETPQRYHLVLAGMLLQPALGCVALIGWAMAPVGSVLRIGLLLIAVRCLIGTVWRLNPLAKSDAYALLMIWRDIPQLYERAKDQAWAWLWGTTAPEALDREERTWFRIYGLLIYVWKAAISLTVLIGGGWLVVSRWHAPGAAVWLALVAVWYWDELRDAVMSFDGLRWLVRGGGRWYVRWAIRLGLLGAIVAAGFLPYPHQEGGEFRVIPAEEIGIRAQTSGEISEIAVQPGQQVQAAQIVAKLNPREQQANFDMTQAELDAAQANLELLKAGARPENIEAATQRVQLDQRRLEYYEGELTRIKGLADTNTVSAAELANAQFDRDSAEKVHAASKEELAALVSGARAEEIRAAEAEVVRLTAQLKRFEQELALAEIVTPIGGRVITAHVQRRQGQYVVPGDLIAVVQESGKLRAEIAATEPAAAFVRVGQPVQLRFWGLNGQLVTGRVSEIAASAVSGRKVESDRVRSDREQMTESLSQQDEGRYVWIYADLDLPPDTLLPEMTGYARIMIGPDRLWHAIARPIQRFVLVEVWSWLP
jgi:putative peptide zinc metalloprotease protein